MAKSPQYERHIPLLAVQCSYLSQQISGALLNRESGGYAAHRRTEGPSQLTVLGGGHQTGGALWCQRGPVVRSAPGCEQVLRSPELVERKSGSEARSSDCDLWSLRSGARNGSGVIDEGIVVTLLEEVVIEPFDRPDKVDLLGDWSPICTDETYLGVIL